MSDNEHDQPRTTNEWRETVRDLYDDLHFGQDNIFTGSRLAARLIHLIEQRHPGFFNEAYPGKVGATDG